MIGKNIWHLNRQFVASKRYNNEDSEKCSVAPESVDRATCMYPNTTSLTQCYLLGNTSRENREKEFCLVRMECRQSCLSDVYHQILFG